MAILTSPLGSVDIPDVSITEYPAASVDESSRQPAMIDGMTGRT